MEAINITLQNILDCKETFPGVLLHPFWAQFFVEMPTLRPYVKCLTNHTGRSNSNHCREIINKLCEPDIHAAEMTNFRCLDKLWFTRQKSNISSNGLNNKDPFTRYEQCVMSQATKAAPCFKLFNNICASHTFRVIKTVRATMQTARELLRTRPQLRVIHLLRDPRAVAMSRSKYWWSQGASTNKSLSKMSHLYCNTVANDISHRISLEAEFPGRIMQVIYDEMVQNPLSFLKSIYNFSGLQDHSSTVDKVIKYTRGSEHKSLQWSGVMKFSEALEIRKSCEKFWILSNYNWTSA